jgi:hypothetical protein
VFLHILFNQNYLIPVCFGDRINKIPEFFVIFICNFRFAKFKKPFQNQSVAFCFKIINKSAEFILDYNIIWFVINYVMQRKRKNNWIW